MDKKIILQMRDFILKYWLPFTTIGTVIISIGAKTFRGFLQFWLLVNSPFILLYITMVLVVKCRKTSKIRKVDGYRRELPFNYSPAVVSVLCDNYSEGLVDIEAVRLNLSIKGLLDNDNIDKNYLEGLSEHELYVLNNKSCISNAKFKELLYNDMEKLGFLKVKKINEIVRFAYSFILSFIFIIVMMIVMSLLNLNGLTVGIAMVFLFLFMIFIVPAILSMSSNVRIKQTELGKEHATEWLKFKNFIQDFTVLNEREKEAIVIYEKYIPYSMAVGVDKKIEEEVFGDYWKKIVAIKPYYTNN